MTNAEVALSHTVAGGGTLDPYRRPVPDALVERIDRLVADRQARTGEPAAVARREVEASIWLFGVNAVERTVQK